MNNESSSSRDKIRRHSSDSARSSLSTTGNGSHGPNDDVLMAAAELISPSSRTNNRESSIHSHENSMIAHGGHVTVSSGMSDARVAGADDISDGSRPGTPLFDERPETEHTSTASNSNTTYP